VSEIDEKTIARYLLGALTKEEQEAVEQRFLDKEFAELCDVIEGELIDDYVFERVPADTKALFEKNFLVSPARLQRVRTVQMVSSYATERIENETIRRPISLAPRRTFKFFPNWKTAWALLIIVLLGVAFFTFNSYRHSKALEAELEAQRIRQIEIQRQLAAAEGRADSSQSEAKRLQQELEDSRIEQEKLKEELSKTYASSSMATVTLRFPDLRAGGKVPVLKIDQHVRNVRIRVPIGETAKDVLLQVVVRNEESKRETLTTFPHQTRGFAVINLPATKLTQGDYVVIVRAKIAEGAFEDLDTFQLRVQKK
jgi:hypothetical protein